MEINRMHRRAERFRQMGRDEAARRGSAVQGWKERSGFDFDRELKAAESRINSKDFAGAEKILRRMLDFYPRQINVAVLLIKALSQQGKLGEARAVFDFKIPLDSGAKLCHTMMISYRSAGDVQKVREIFDIAVKRGVAKVVTYDIIAAAYYKSGRYMDAIEVLGTAPDELFRLESGNSSSAEIILQLADAMRKSKMGKLAISLAERVIANTPEDPGNYYPVRAKIIRAFCMVWMGSEMAEHAKEEFLKLKAEVPRTSPHYPRILCGCVFSGAINGEGGKEIIGPLNFYRGTASDSMAFDIDNALAILAGKKKRVSFGHGLPRSSRKQPPGSETNPASP